MPESPVAIWKQPDTVAKFIEHVRSSTPLGIEQIDVILRLIAAARDEVGAFLNIGCGDGLLAAALLDEFPAARGLLLDASAPLVDLARQRLRKQLHRIDCQSADLVPQTAWCRQTAAFAPFDAIICSFATGNLLDARKRAIYEEAFALLKPDGVFLNIEVVASATRWTESIIGDYLINAIFGDERSDPRHRSAAEIARAYYRRSSRNSPSCAPLEVQCDWLREAGYINVACYLKVLELAIFGGQRPG